jgi:hypothetical protein
MKPNTLLVLCIAGISLLLLVVWLLCKSKKEQFEKGSSTFYAGKTLYPAYQHPDDFQPSLLSHNPKVQGVTIVDSTRIFKQAALNAGLLPIEAADQLLPPPLFKGQAAFQANVGVIQNTLELSPTQEYQRAELASAQTGYTPPQGLDNLHLWNSRTTIDRLQQPGFSVVPPSYSALPYF